MCFSLLFFISYNFDKLVLHLKNGGLPMFTIYNVLRFTNVYNYQFTMEMFLRPRRWCLVIEKGVLIFMGSYKVL